jgi:creatinine amidohydrolase
MGTHSNTNGEAERRVQYMLPFRLREERDKLPLIFLPLGPLEWHGPHMAPGMDAINAERVALGVARETGGVVLPTLYMGTERERDPATLKSLGFRPDEHVVGMDFPNAKGIYGSFYFPEELFSLTVRGFIEQCIANSYRFIYIVNGHGALNHNAVLKRLCWEFSHHASGVKVAYGLAFPDEEVRAGALAHAGSQETSLLMYYHPSAIDLKRLPPDNAKLPYADYSIVDGGGFSGNPGPDYCLPREYDPRFSSSPDEGKKLYDRAVKDVAKNVRTTFGIQ